MAHQQSEARAFGAAAAGAAELRDLFLAIGEPAIERGGHREMMDDERRITRREHRTSRRNPAALMTC